MNRRQALMALAAGGMVPDAIAEPSFFAEVQGVAVAKDVRTGAVLFSHRLDVARMLFAPPGSTIKPFTLLALLHAKKLRPNEAFPCSGQLKIAGRSFACTHPRTATPIDLSTAIAYSCNEFVARVATRFEPGEFAEAASRLGLSGSIDRVAGIEAQQLQALGEDHISVNVEQLADAYRRLAVEPGQVLEGLEGAVEFGTAQRAQVPGIKVAGKTGSASGRFAWFAGFAPSRSPKVVVAVMVQGRAGGADAAPIAGQILASCLEGKR